MRIGQFSDSFLPVVDGVGRVVASYASTMAALGERVTVVAPQADMGDTSALSYDIITYNTVPMPGRMPYRIGFPGLDIHYDRQVSGIALDIVHVHSPFMSGHAGLSLAKRRGIPVVGTFHSKYYDDFSLALKSELLARGGVKAVVHFYEQCDEVWAVNEATGETLASYGYGGRIEVMPNGTDVRALDSAIVAELRERYALPEGVPVLLYAGQLNWKKNIRRILEAASILKEAGAPFRLILAGQGPNQEEIRQKGEALGLGDRLLLPGHIGDTRTLDGLYALASLFVFPSLYDNAPMVVREAAVMGTPSVLVEGSNAAEGVIGGENGFTCMDSAESLAETIAGALRDPARLLAVGRRARETIPVPWTTLVGRVLERYRTLLGQA